MVGSVEPLLDGSVDGPACGGGDDLRREGRRGGFGDGAPEDDAMDGRDDGCLHEGFEGVLAGAGVGVGCGEVVAGGENDGPESGGTGAVVGDVAVVQELVEASANHGSEESEFVGVVVVEGSAVDGGGFGDVLD